MTQKQKQSSLEAAAMLSRKPCKPFRKHPKRHFHFYEDFRAFRNEIHEQNVHDASAEAQCHS